MTLKTRSQVSMTNDLKRRSFSEADAVDGQKEWHFRASPSVISRCSLKSLKSSIGAWDQLGSTGHINHYNLKIVLTLSSQITQMIKRRAGL